MLAIELRDLHYRYPAARPHEVAPYALQGIDLEVEAGEFVALMGHTGAGKSTLCMALNGLVPQATGGAIRGVQRVLGHDVRAVPVARLARQVGLVFQDPESQLFSPTVEQEVAFGPENLGLPVEVIRERVDWALDLLELQALRQRGPTQLSGGQKQRVAIAAALAMEPQLLVLDEPTSGLDPLGTAEVFAAIERLCLEREVTVVLATQDAEQVAQFAHRVVVLSEGRVVLDAATAAAFAQPELLAQAGVAPPQVSRVAAALRERLGEMPALYRLDDAERALRALWEQARA
ncbi:MAG: energy-coupling factor ABC transporter ATP-binding protein [Anaerolineae bacterium]